MAERWRPEQKDRAKAAPYRDYKGDKHDAFWYFDKEMAGLTEARYAKYKGKQMQYLGFMQRGRLVKYDAGQHAGVIAAFRPEADGLTFHVKGVYTDSLRSSLVKEHAHGGIEVTRICGPVAKVNDTTFTVRFIEWEWIIRSVPEISGCWPLMRVTVDIRVRYNNSIFVFLIGIQRENANIYFSGDRRCEGRSGISFS